MARETSAPAPRRLLAARALHSPSNSASDRILRPGGSARCSRTGGPAFPGLYLYYPSRRPAGLRAFIDMMQSESRSQAL